MAIPIALTIAGSDSGGGAGIQADLKSFSANRVYGASVITALTAQNTRGVTAIHDVPAAFVTAQIDAVFSDLAVAATKIGMVAQRGVIAAIAEGLDRWHAANVVLDPVMVATSGDRLIADDCVDALRTVLIPRARIITPNLPEAAALLDEPVADEPAEIERQGRHLLALGCEAVLIKGDTAPDRPAPITCSWEPRCRRCPHRGSSPTTPTVPAARCPPRSPPIWRKASRCRPLWPPPSNGSAPPSQLRIGFRSGMATARSIISTASTKAQTGRPCAVVQSSYSADNPNS